MSDTVELAVPGKIWEVSLDPSFDPWATQVGLPAPDLRDRGRGQQAVYEVDRSTAMSMLDRIESMAAAVESQQLRARIRAWARKMRSSLDPNAPAPTSGRRRKKNPNGPVTRTSGAEVEKMVTHYLEYVDTENVPIETSGRPVEVIEADLAEIETKLGQEMPYVDRLALLQKARELEAERVPRPVGTPDELEARFVKVARSFATARGITRGAFEDFGVRAEVLDRAGLRAE